MHAEMFQDWSMTAAQRNVANSFFRFQHDSNATGRNIRMTYSYDSLTDQVPVTELPAYDSAQRTLKDTLGYTFTYSTPDQLTAMRKKDPLSGYGQFNWPIAILTGAILAIAIALAVGYCLLSKLPSPLPPSLTDPSLEGIGGWLFLVGFGLVLRPLSFLVANSQIYSSVFRLEAWRNLTQAGQPAYHPYWMPTLLFELIYNSLALVLCGLVLFLFFKKRASWPFWFVAMFLFFLTGVGVDYALSRHIPAVTAAMGDTAKGIVQTVAGACIWIPYALTSKRVKATFRY
jgi:hypothetical protein